MANFPLENGSNPSLIRIILSDPIDEREENGSMENFRRARATGVHILSPEWVLESIVQFALQPFEPYEEHF